MATLDRTVKLSPQEAAEVAATMDKKKITAMIAAKVDHSVSVGGRWQSDGPQSHKRSFEKRLLTYQQGIQQ